MHTGTHGRLDTLPFVVQHQPFWAVASRHADGMEILAGAKLLYRQVSASPSTGDGTFLVDLTPSALHR